MVKLINVSTKVVCTGALGSGKTDIFKPLFKISLLSRPEASFGRIKKRVKDDDLNVEFNIDAQIAILSSREELKEIRKKLIREADLIFVSFNFKRKNTFDQLDKYFEEAYNTNPSAAYTIVGYHSSMHGEEKTEINPGAPLIKVRELSERHGRVFQYFEVHRLDYIEAMNALLQTIKMHLFVIKNMPVPSPF
ncbi:MAG: hypothetical protein J7L47_01170 [Candidatus Odinarchaeota archaeon]|nr:hypothetical protein [Candidatus Odinarchaeota archaeon]